MDTLINQPFTFPLWQVRMRIPIEYATQTAGSYANWKEAQKRIKIEALHCEIGVRLITVHTLYESSFVVLPVDAIVTSSGNNYEYTIPMIDRKQHPLISGDKLNVTVEIIVIYVCFFKFTAQRMVKYAG